MLNGFFVASEFALVSVRRTRIDELVANGNRRARVVRRSLQDLDSYIAATQLGITIASLALGSVAEPAVAGLVDSVGDAAGIPSGVTDVVAVAVALAIVVFLHLLIGEMVPKSIALTAPERTLTVLVLPVAAFVWLFRPVVWVLNALARLGTRLLGVEPADELRSSHTAAELTAMIGESTEEGLLDDDDLELLTRTLALVERPVLGIMVPRERICSIDRTDSVEVAEAAVRSSGHSRILVTAGDLDHIVGFVHVKDLLDVEGAQRSDRVAVRVRSHLTVDEDDHLVDVLVSMQTRRIHVAVVVDDRGATVGMVTLEDVLESVVGDILDESDRDS